MGRSRGGLTAKIRLLTNELGLPLDFLITGGQVNERTQAIELLGQHKADAVLADKGYDAGAIVEHVEAMGAKAVIPPERNRKVNASTTKISTNNAIASNVASANSNVFADSPPVTRNRKTASRPSSLSHSLGCT